MRQIVAFVILFAALFACKTGEIDDMSILKPEISFEINEHLLDGNDIRNLTVITQKNFFYSVGSVIFQVVDGVSNQFNSDSEVLCMAWNSKEQVLYFGSLSSGLGRLGNNNIQYFTVNSHGLPRNLIYEIDCDDYGTVWFSSSAHKLGGLASFNKGKIEVFTPENSLLPDNMIKSIACRGEKVFVATGGYVTQQKVISIDRNGWELLPFKGYFLMDMAVDRDGKLYVIDDVGLSSLSTMKNSIWFYDGFQVKNVAPDLARFIYAPYKLKTDLRNYLWVAKFQDGTTNLSVFDGQSWNDAPTGFSDFHINSIVVDTKNCVWLGTNDGIFKLFQ